MNFVINFWQSAKPWHRGALLGVCFILLIPVETIIRRNSILSEAELWVLSKPLKFYLIQPQLPFPSIYMSILYFIFSAFVRVAVSIVLWGMFQKISDILGNRYLTIFAVLLLVFLFLPWINTSDRIDF